MDARRPLDEWFCWLSQLTDEQAGMPADHVRRLWGMLVEGVGESLPAPAADRGGDLGFYMAWHREDVYLDVDVAPDGRFEWFWTNRRTGEAEGSEDERLDKPTDALVHRLRSLV